MTYFLLCVKYILLQEIIKYISLKYYKACFEKIYTVHKNQVQSAANAILLYHIVYH